MDERKGMVTVPVQFTLEQLSWLRRQATSDGNRSLASVVRAAVDRFRVVEAVRADTAEAQA